jgi:hypothetical protein
MLLLMQINHILFNFFFEVIFYKKMIFKLYEKYTKTNDFYYMQFKLRMC